MAEKKYLDKDGVGHLYKKAREGVLTDEALAAELDCINYLSDDELPDQTFTVTSTATETRALTLSDTGFEFGRAKRITVTISGSIDGGKKGSNPQPNKVTIQLKVPNTGKWFWIMDTEYGFYSGGSALISFSKSALAVGTNIQKISFSETYTFYLAKVK